MKSRDASPRYRARISIVRGLLAGLVAALLAGCPLPAAPRPAAPSTAAEVSLHAVDVGQGDALLLLVGRGAARRVVLVDGGPPGGAEGLLATLRRHDVRAIDLLVITHAHLDHIGGIARVLDEIPVREVIDPGVPHTTATYRKLLRRLVRLREQGALRYRVARRGLDIDLGGIARLRVLAPEEPLVQGSRSDLNANSVVLRVLHGRVALLLTGDAERETEARLLASGEELRADVLKVAHHGSRHATGARFLARVRPKVAIVSCGRDNRYGHPAPETLDRLRAAGALVLRTDRAGTVSIVSDSVRVRTAKEVP